MGSNAAFSNLQDSPFGSMSDRLSTAIWVFDFDLFRVVWANAAALKVWGAESCEDLAERDLGTDMSPSVELRMRQYQTDLANPETKFSELWTLFPQGKPTTLNVTFSGIPLEDGRLGMLCEGVVDQAREPDAIRSAQALLHMPVIISLFSSSGDVLYLNPAARSTRTELGLGLVERFSDPHQGEKFFETLKAQQTSKTVARVTTTDGERWHEISGVRSLDSVTGSEAYLISELDVTELKEAEKRAERADRSKSEFLANMSHELRTPLNAIIGFADFMVSGNMAGSVPPKYTEYVTDIRDSGQHLLQLINDILDIAKIETGEMQLYLEEVSIDETFRAIGRIMTQHARKKNVDLTITPIGNELSVNADVRRFKQILLNLLSNAIKFTEQGGSVSLEAQLRGDFIAVIVEDTGIGMTPEDVEESLRPFRQVDNSITRGFEGTGLGLPLSKSLAESQGGTLEIVSEPGKGTTVTVLIPAQIGNQMIRACA